MINNITNAFDNATSKICKRCVANKNCDATKTKCAEYETLLVIKNEYEKDELVIERCDDLTKEIIEKEKACLERGICPYCGGKYEQSDIQTEE